MKRILLTTSALMAGTLGVPHAIAQDATEAGEQRRLETVTVTATKREQTLQDVPVAVQVVDNTTIEQAEILDIGDLQSIVPSLRVGQLQSSTNTSFFIRGFGNGANNAGIEPSVAVYIDGVYRSRAGAQISDLPNLERVEVLKGPQSTLFGKNASAGVISVVTEAPQDTFGGNVEGTLSNYDGYRASGYLTGPLTEGVNYSLAANINKRDGYADDLALNTDVNSRDRWGVRGQLLIEPNDTTSFRLIADYDEIDENCCVAGNILNGPTGAVIFALGGAIDPEDPFSYEVFNNLESSNELENGGLSLQGDFAFDGFDITSITAFRTTDIQSNQDSDFTSADLVGRNFNTTEYETFTQEVRITSNSSDESRFDWMLGAYYFDETVDLENQFFYGADFRNYGDILATLAADPTANPAVVVGGILTGAITSPLAQLEAALGLPVGSTFEQDGQGYTEAFGQDNTAYSIFGTLDVYITDRLTATLGLNYTEDEKDAYGRIDSTDVFSAVDLVAVGFGQALAGVGVDPTDPVAVGTFAATNPEAFAAIQAGAQDPAANPLFGPQALQFLPPFLNYPNSGENGSTRDDDLTYTIRLAYELTDNVNVYGSVATGFKASSWNLSRDSRPFASDFIPGSPVTSPPPSPIRDAGLAVPNLTTGTRFAGPEESTVYEIGVKAAFDRVAVNLSVFDQSIEGFQSNVFTGTGFALANAGEQSVEGLELDVTWTPIDPLTLVFSGTFLDTLFDSFEEAAGGDLSGEQPCCIPETALSTAATYDFKIANWDGFIRGDWQYESEIHLFDNPSLRALSNDLSREVNTVNGSIGFESPNGLGITFWGRNIFEDEYVTTAFPSVAQDGSVSGYPNQPQTYGVTVKKSF